MYVSEIYKKHKSYSEKEVTFIGRVRSHRQGKKISFIVVNDGTTINDIQIVYKEDLPNIEETSKARVSSIIEVTGKLVLTPGKPQPFEVVASKIDLLDQS